MRGRALFLSLSLFLGSLTCVTYSCPVFPIACVPHILLNPAYTAPTLIDFLLLFRRPAFFLVVASICPSCIQGVLESAHLCHFVLPTVPHYLLSVLALYSILPFRPHTPRTPLASASCVVLLASVPVAGTKSLHLHDHKPLCQ